MKNRWSLVSLSILIISPNVRALPLAEESCANQTTEIAELRRQISNLERRFDLLTLGQHSQVTLDPTVRLADGSVKRMNHEEAVSYCASRGGLPTVKQLALALNPMGVSDSAREGAYRIYPRNESAFHYDNSTYLRPSGDEVNEWFWSSSILVERGAYVLLGNSGVIGGDYRSSRHAVRCVSR